MSATIKYKGSTIATADNNTKTLKTAGKYLEDDIIVRDNGGGGELPKVYIESVYDNSGVFKGKKLHLDSSITQIGSYQLQAAIYRSNAENQSIDFSNIKNVSPYGLYQFGYAAKDISEVYINSLEQVGVASLQDAFNGSGLTKLVMKIPASLNGDAFSGMCSSCVNLSSLTIEPPAEQVIVSSNNCFASVFEGCKKLTGDIDLSFIKELKGLGCFSRAFYNTKITSVNFHNLTNITAISALYYFCYGINTLTSVDFTNLTTITGSNALQYAFASSSLSSLSFPSLTNLGTYTNQFNRMLSGVINCTVHFPAALQSTIGSWTDVTAGFGGTNTTVLFDL